MGLILAGLLSGCGISSHAAEAANQYAPPADRGSQEQAPVLTGSVAEPVDATRSMEEPGPLRGKPVRPDILVVGDDSLPGPLRERVRKVPGVRSAVELSLASTAVAGRSITTAAVDAASYRRFAPESRPKRTRCGGRSPPARWR